MESVLSQQNADFELIVVDDGSRDRTCDYLKPLEDAGRLRVLRQSHQGVSEARNAGVAAGRGEFIAFLDSDDEWLPGKLSAQVEFLRAGEYAIVQTREIWIRKGKRVNAPVHLEKVSGNIFSASLRNCMITPSSVMLARRLWEQSGGFDPAFPACEDYDLWLRICRKHPVGLIPMNLMVRHGGRADQLSALYPGMDKYRVMAIVKLLRSAALSLSQKAEAISVAREKLRIYRLGCEKRDRLEEIAWCGEMESELLGPFGN